MHTTIEERQNLLRSLLGDVQAGNLRAICRHPDLYEIGHEEIDEAIAGNTLSLMTLRIDLGLPPMGGCWDERDTNLVGISGE